MTKNAFFTVILLLYVATIYGQIYSISGQVLGTKNEPIIGANILVSGTKQAAAASSAGNFVLEKIIPGNYTLKITAVGYISKEISVTVQNSDEAIGKIILQEDFLQLEQVVVTTTRNEIRRKDAPIVCNIIDDKILKATQSIVLAEGLSFQPALRIENNCQSCGFNSLRMNGLEGAYSQILVDGRPIFNSLQGVYGLEQIPANMIERVEIVRSGGSALYGSSAVAGTVNIITREPTENSTYLNTNQAFIDGSSPDRTYMVGTDYVTEDRKVGVTLNAFNRNRSEWDSNGDGFSEIGQLKATSIATKAYYKPTELSKITFNAYSIHEFRRGGNKFEIPPHEADIAEQLTHNILNGGLTYEQYSKSKDHKFSTYLNYQTLKRDSYYGSNQDINAYGDSEDNSMVGGFQYTGKLGKFAGGTHTFVSGIEVNHNNLKDNAPSYDRFINQTANQVGIYVQDVIEIANKFNILLGGRFDHHNLVGEPILSPRANILYKLNNDLQLRVGYARGFRAPQVFDEDLHISQVNGGGSVIRNSNNLTPEYSNAFSASVDFNKYYKDWSVGLTIDGFHTRLTDVFILEEQNVTDNGDLLLERRNGDGATVTGFTINPKLQYKDKFSMQLGLTIQQSFYDKPVQWSESIENKSKRFFRTPDNYGFYVLTWNPIEKVTLNLSGVYTSSMLAQHFAGFIENDVLETTPSFFENNFKIDYAPTLKGKFGITFTAGIQNFTNAYQSDFDLGVNRDSAYIYGPGRPRTFFVGTNINL